MNTLNLNSALKSMLRLQLMKDKHYPSIITDTESAILSQRMKKLSQTEIKFIHNNFPKFYKEYLLDSEIQDIAFESLLEKDLNKLN